MNVIDADFRWQYRPHPCGGQEDDGLRVHAPAGPYARCVCAGSGRWHRSHSAERVQNYIFSRYLPNIYAKIFRFHHIFRHNCEKSRYSP